MGYRPQSECHAPSRYGRYASHCWFGFTFEAVSDGQGLALLETIHDRRGQSGNEATHSSRDENRFSVMRPVGGQWGPLLFQAYESPW